MTKFDITNIMAEYATSSLEVLTWLETNIGAPKPSRTFDLVGEGWNIVDRIRWTGDPSKTSTITMTNRGQSLVKSYELTIEDDEKATLFALKWL